MFDRFTDRARKVMALANQEANRLRHAYIAPEHVLLGLLREGAGVGANVLKGHGVDLKAMRASVAEAVPPAAEDPPPGRLPQTQSAKRLIQRTIEEARHLRHDYVGTEHLVLALLFDDGIAGQLLRATGVDYGKALATVEELLGRGWEVAPDGREAHAGATPGSRAPARQRYTHRARQAFALADEVARRRGCTEIQLEHLLLGVLRQDAGGAVQMLRELGLDAAAVAGADANENDFAARNENDRAAGAGDAATRADASGARPTSPRTGLAIRTAILLSEAQGGRYVGTEHLLLALMFVDDDVRGRLAHAGVRLTELREKAAEIAARNGDEGDDT